LVLVGAALAWNILVRQQGQKNFMQSLELQLTLWLRQLKKF
jgi:hypothetical protein